MSGFTIWALGKKPPPTPSPAEYTLPDAFGSGPKFSLKGRNKERRPSPCPSLYREASTLSKKGASFGIRAPEKPKDVIPGPSVDTSIPIGSQCPKFSIRSKLEDPPNTNPGPGQYRISREFTSVQQTIGRGKRSNIIDPNLIADPGSIRLPSQWENPPGISFGPSIPLPEPERNGPGPIYDQKTTMGQDTPYFSISRAPRDPIIHESPGPADYQQIRPLTSSSRIPYRIKNRTKLPQPDICDYPYHAYPGTITPRKLSHGIRPKTTDQTPGPGPYYNCRKSAEDSRQSKIGIRTPIKNPLDENPAPTDYFTVPITPYPTPLCPILGPTEDDRAPINFKKEAEKPGPGYYDDQPTNFERPRTGYYFTSRMMNDFVPDTAAPYYPAQSTLGGPKFVIS